MVIERRGWVTSPDPMQGVKLVPPDPGGRGCKTSHDGRPTGSEICPHQNVCELGSQETMTKQFTIFSGRAHTWQISP